VMISPQMIISEAIDDSSWTDLELSGVSNEEGLFMAMVFQPDPQSHVFPARKPAHGRAGNNHIDR
jgi:hypothetical protein